jgi:hypothetical protein
MGADECFNGILDEMDMQVGYVRVAGLELALKDY